MKLLSDFRNSKSRRRTSYWFYEYNILFTQGILTLQKWPDLWQTWCSSQSFTFYSCCCQGQIEASQTLATFPKFSVRRKSIMARLNGLLSHSSMQSTRSWTAYSSFDILDLVFSLCSHFLPFMSAGLCRVNFHYFVDFVGCPGMISNHDFISGNSDQSTLHLRALIHSNFNSYWSKYMQKTDDA